jgi:putative DNA primase/helicase
LSVSAGGLRLFGRGRLPIDGRRKDGIEIYRRGHYLTVTGHRLEGSPAEIAGRQEELAALLADLWPTPQSAERNGRAHHKAAGDDLTSEDLALVEEAKRAADGEKFAALWDGDIEDYDDDDSRADQALLCLLAFWTREDAARMERLFSASALGQREKWTGRADYRERSIKRALETTRSVLEPHLTDHGNAIRLVAAHGADLRYCHPWNGWLAWDGARWCQDDTAEAARRAKRTISDLYARTVAEMAGLKDSLEESAGRIKQLQRLQTHALKSESAPRINALLDLARSEPGIPVLPEDLDRDGWLLNCPNGTLDLRTGQLREHRRGDLLTKLCPTLFDPEAQCQRWLRFLDEIFEDKDLPDFAQRLLGYCLTGNTCEHILAVFHGAGGNGKSVFIGTLFAVLGDDYALAAMPDFLLSRHGERHPTEIAALFGKRVLVCQETGSGRRLNEGLVKWLTGDDMLTARRMRENFWSFQPSHKTFLVTNHKPVIAGQDDGIWRRLRLIPFTRSFPEDKQDKALSAKLRAEAPGILAWMVRGCLDWQKFGMMTPKCVLTATKKYREE